MNIQKNLAPNSQTGDSNQILSLFGEVEERLAQLKNWQRESEEQFTHLHQQNEQINQYRTELDKRAKQLNQLEQAARHTQGELDNKQAQIEQQHRELSSKQNCLDRKTAEAEETSTRIRDQKTQIQQRIEEATRTGQEQTKLQQQLEDQRSELDSERHQLDHRLADAAKSQREFEKRIASFEQDQRDCEQHQQEAQSLREQMLQAQQQIKTDRMDLCLREETLGAQEEQLEKVRRRLATEATEIPIHNRHHEELEADLNARRVELDEQEKQFEHHKQEISRHRDDFKQLQDDLRKREDELHQKSKQIAAERDELKRQKTTFEHGNSGNDTENERFDTTKIQLKRTQNNIQKRRQRLRRHFRMLRERTNQLKETESRMAANSAQYAGMNKERQMLLEVKKFLEASETEMIQKWATKSAWGLIVGTLCTALFLAWFSYAISQQLVLPVWQATMVLESSLPQDQDIPQTSAWISTQNATLMSQPVLNETFNQLRQRGTRMFADSEALKADLKQNLTVSGKPGQLKLAYRSEQKQEVIAVAEAIGKGMLAYQLALDRAAGGEDSIRIAEPAMRDSQPVEDRRLIWSGSIFGSTCAVALVLAVLFRFWLVKMKCQFEENYSPQMSILDQARA